MNSWKTLLLKLFIATCMFFPVVILMAQPETNAGIVIRGKITDKKTKAVLHGVSIVEVNKDGRTLGGASTDVNGNFAIKIKNTANKLSFSFIGYKQQSVNIGSQTQVNVQLEAGEGGELDDVAIVVQKKKYVDNGTGMSIAQRDLTTAVSSIDAATLQEMQAPSIDQALQGRLPGVDIIANSGDPGVGMQIRIRGTSSINAGTDPLIVVDGMPFEITVPEGFNFATEDEQGYAQLLNIAPTDIKDISVLKDAAATAIWGARAANGVLVINTKRGRSGKPSLSYTFKGSLSSNPSAIPMLNGNQYSQLIPEAYMNATGLPLNTDTYKEFLYDVTNPYWYYNYGNNTNWIDEITRTGNLQDHNVSVSGGGEKAQYYASLSYFNQNGTTRGTSLERVSARINLDYKVSSRIKFKADVAYTNLDNNQLYASNARNIAYRKMPSMSVYEYDEYGNLTPNYFSPDQNIQGQYKATYNPLAMVESAINHQKGNRITPHFNINYAVIPNILTATSDVQFDINSGKTGTFLPQLATGRPFTETVVNRASDANYDAFNVTSKTNLIFTPKLGRDHNFQGLFSVQTSDYRYEAQQILTSNTASSLIQDPAAPSRTENSDLGMYSTKTQTRTIAGVLSAQYGLLDRYLINVGIRADGNSRFGPGNRWGVFPSISARWRVSSEPFLRQFKALSEFSFRASYGQTGNAPNKDYSYYNIYSNYGWSYLGETGIYSQNVELQNLRWETVAGTNFGVNIGLFNNRFTLDGELYRNRTRDMLFSDLGVMAYSGYSSVDMNVGTMDNQGWEINLNANILKTKDWQVDFNFNIAHNENVIRSISPRYPTENVKEITTNGVYKSVLLLGNPFGSFYGFQYEGVYKDKDETIATGKDGKPITGLNGDNIYMRFGYPNIDYTFQPGDAKYKDVNNDGNIDYRDIVYLGNSNPQYTGGFGPTVTFKKNLKVTAFFNFRTGYQLINGTEMATTNMYNFDNQSTTTLQRWRREGDVTDVPRALYGRGYNWLGSSRYVQDGSYLRWRMLTVRYDLPAKYLKKLKVQGLGFYVTTENLITFTKYLGQDPEVNTRITSPFTIAIDNSMTPPVKTVTLGLTARF